MLREALVKLPPRDLRAMNFINSSKCNGCLLPVLIRDSWFQMPNALHQGSPRQLGLPQYSNWSVMSLFSLSNNLTFEKDLLPTSGKLLSYVF